MTKNNIKSMSFSTVITYLDENKTPTKKKKLIVFYYDGKDPAFLNVAIGDPFSSELVLDIKPFREDIEKVFKKFGNYLPNDEGVDEFDVIISYDSKDNIWFDYKGGDRKKEVLFAISPRQAKKLMKLMSKVYPFDDYADKEPEDFE